MNFVHPAYTCYKAQLKSLKKAGYRHSAQRKQQSLRTASHRYGMPISEVKAIVRDYESTTQSELDRIRDFEKSKKVSDFVDRLKEAERKADSVCGLCGESDDTVRARVSNPSVADLDSAEICVLCFDCYTQDVGPLSKFYDFLDKYRTCDNERSFLYV